MVTTSGLLNESTHTAVVGHPRADSNAFSWCCLPPGGRVDEQRELNVGYGYQPGNCFSVPFDDMG